MFGESRWVTVTVIVVALLAFVVFGLAVWAIVAERNDDRDATITTAVASNVYVDPSRYPGWQGVPDDVRDTTPVAPAPGGSGGNASAAPAKGGGFFSFGSSVPSDLPAGYGKADLSASFRKVRIASVSAVDPNGYNAANNASVIRIRENVSGKDVVNLTGMRLKTNADAFLIPRAAKFYKTTGSGLADVSLGNGQDAYIIGSSSPVNANFMGNACNGYLNAAYDFVPDLSGGCQVPPKREIETFSGACQDYILSTAGSCKAGNPNDSRIPAGDGACRSYVAGFTYDGCVERRQGEEKFLNGSWNVFAGRSIVDPRHDLVLLLDGGGKLVDYYRY